MTAVRDTGASNIGFLFDLFHLANNGDDLDAAISAYADLIAHVQIADHPGRGEPGTGTLDFDHYLTRIEPSPATPATLRASTTRPPRPSESFAWLPAERRSTGL